MSPRLICISVAASAHASKPYRLPQAYIIDTEAEPLSPVFMQQNSFKPHSGRNLLMPEAIKPIDVEALKALVRTVPDFPKPGILFYDITTLLKDKTGFARLIDALAAHYLEQKIDLVLGIEARGFIFGPALAYRLNAGFVPVRKPRKLPAPVARVTYELEYGSDTLEIHLDAIAPGQRVVLVDDLLATGGTMEATIKLVKQLGGEIAGLAFAVELDFLKGRERFTEYDVFSLLHYDE